jgi:hypothetical protein
MKPGHEKTREELLAEITTLRREKAAAEAEAVRVQQPAKVSAWRAWKQKPPKPCRSPG